MRHLSEKDLEGFWENRLDAAELREVVRHLTAGCAPCEANLLAAEPPEPAFWELECPQDDAYDAAIDGAWRTARKALPRINDDRRRRELGLELLRQKGSMDNLTWPERRSFRGVWPHVEIFLERSFAQRYSDPKKMLRYAEAAQQSADWMAAEKAAAERIGAKAYPECLQFDLRARAWGELANAYRVNERYVQSGNAFAKAHRLLEQGTRDPLLEAHLLDMEASLRRAQADFDEALRLLDQAERLYRRFGEEQLAARATMRRGNCLRLAGRLADAAKALKQAIGELDPGRDPKLVAIAHHTLIEIAIEANKFAAAGRVLFESGLRQRYSDEPLNLLRLRWTEAKILVGRGRLADAERVFGDVRAGFLEHELHYDAALTGVDLALVMVKQGKDIRKLAVEIRLACMEKGINQEALQAIFLLERLAKHKAATATRVQRLRDFLGEVQSTPGLRHGFHAASFVV